MIAAGLRAQDAQTEDGGLIAYADRLARKRETVPLPMGHLAPLASRYEAVERAIRRQGPPIFECHHAPVQHGKSSLIQAFIVRTLRRNPHVKIGYASFSAYRAENKMGEVRDLAQSEGIRISPGWDRQDEWRTVEGGMVVAGGIVGGPWTGQGFDVLIIDDPYKDESEAWSRAHRDKVEHAFEKSIWTRRAPWTSIIVNHARWHPHDLIGSLEASGWRYVRLGPFKDDDSPLWPERWPLEELLAIRDGRPATTETQEIKAVLPTTWASLYLGLPRAEGSRIFDPAHLVTYSTLPTGPYVEALGLDLAYGKKARNDRSSFTVFRRYSAEPRALYLVETWTGREAVELFACRVAEAQLRRGGLVSRLPLPRTAADVEAWRADLSREEVKRARRIQARWYTSTTESGVADLMPGYGARVGAERATVDKLARAQGGGYTAAWAEGRIRVPAREDEHQRAWRVAHEDFTGADGDADDPVDGSVAAHDLLYVPPASLGSGRSITFGRRDFASREG
jgi:hypothetical protein